MEHTTKSDIQELESKDFSPEDFQRVGHPEHFNIPKYAFPSLAKEEHGSEVMLVIKGKIHKPEMEKDEPMVMDDAIHLEIYEAALVHGKKLSYQERKELSSSSFVFPKERAYPINDESHARNALARASQFERGVRLEKIKSAIRRKFPGIKQGGK